MNLFYVQADGDTFVRHIHDIEPTRWDEDNFCRVAKLRPEQREHFGVHQLKLITPPAYDPITQSRENGPALLVDGEWVQNWVVTDIDAETAEEKIAAQWGFIRARRNDFLAATDWWVTKAAETGDVLSEDKHAYRQDLRDITTQPDPFNIVWPELPA